MEVLDIYEILEVVVAHKKKWGLYITTNGDEKLFQDFLGALFSHEGNLVTDEAIASELSCVVGRAVLFFETQEEMQKVFGILCQKPFYSSRLFAVTVDPTGKLLSENT